MADFLLELFSEEIPARMQADAAAQLAHAFDAELQKAGLLKNTRDVLETYVTPRRLAIWVKDLPETQPDTIAERKGPRIDAPDAALQGFLKSTGLSLEQLEKRADGKAEVYFAVIHQKGRTTADVLREMVEKILKEFSWPKSMRWASHDFSWVRPLHNILCIFGGAVVPVKFHHLTANNITYGHRFMAPAAITITNAAEYEPALKKAFVIADADVRKNEIWRQMESAAAEKKCTLKPDARLLEEVTGLVEWPVVLVGQIADNFMTLPEEVLVSEMKQHQKYFPLYIQPPLPLGEGRGEGLTDAGREALTQPSPRGRGLSPFILITANRTTLDGGKAVVAGNERVLRARLSDGEFFWNQDRATPLAEWAKKLSTVTYHAKIGTVAEKVGRIETLAEKIAVVIGADTAKTNRAAQLCKADLVTGMVGEFPELQGVMGRYYATAQNEAPEVADAIRDHYLPLGPDSPVPTAPVSICVALADKIDTLASLFTIGEKPTGSKDPFALRRAALGVIRIILENGLRLPLADILPLASIKAHIDCYPHLRNTLFNENIQKYHDEILAGKLKLESILLPELENIPPEQKEALKYFALKKKDELLAFFHDRLKVSLKDQGVRHDVIAASIGDDDDLTRIVNRAKAVQAFLDTADGATLLAGYRRAANILTAEEKKDGKNYAGDANAALLNQAEEKTLHSALSAALPDIKTALAAEDFTLVMQRIATLRPVLDAFFDNVMVNAPEPALRENRLRLLSHIRATLNLVADFGTIEG